MCPPRVGRSVRPATKRAALSFAAAVTKSKLRRKRRRGGSGDGSDSGEDSWDGPNWDGWDGRGDSGGYGGWGGSNSWGYGNWDGGFFHRAVYDGLWVWQLLCAASLFQTVHFMICPKPASQQADSAAVGSPVAISY
eukprot:jgi/Chrzof1/8837/Cz03g26030.t1